MLMFCIYFLFLQYLSFLDLNNFCNEFFLQVDVFLDRNCSIMIVNNNGEVVLDFVCRFGYVYVGIIFLICFCFYFKILGVMEIYFFFFL